MFGRKNNKGFSLVELLAAIVIMGILTGIGIVSVTYLINKTEKEYYKAQESEIIMAAKSYTQDNRGFLPKRVGQKNQIYLKTLQSKKYIGEVLDRNKKKCDPDRSYVQVYRYSKNNYSYVVNLVCDSYTSEDNSPTNLVGPNITFNFEGIGSNDNYDLAKVTVTIEDEDKISGYRYIISKSGNEVKNSGDVDGKLEKKITFTIPLKEFVPGTIEVKVVATDFYGNESTKKETKTIKNSKAPTCTVLKANTTWTNKPPVEVQVKCIDYTGLGCKKDVYTQLFYTEAKIGLVEMEDNTGNKGECSANTYIDLTPPSTPVIKNTYENKWINKSYTVQVTSVDDTSGIAYFEYRYPDSNGKDGNGNPENEWHRYEDSSKDPGDNTPFVTTAFSKERGEYVEIRACDLAGNCSEPGRSMIKIDKTAPTCTVTKNIASPNGDNSWYKTNVTLTINTTDPKGSSDRAVNSPLSYDVKNSNSASYGGNTSGTQSDTAGITWYGFVKDEAGNKGTCNSGSFKVDTSKPTCSLSTSGTKGVEKWFRSNVTVKLARKSDSLSGVASYDVSSSSSASYSNRTSGTASSEGANITWYGYVKDNAGNINSCSTSFGIDKTKPNISTDSVGTGTTWCSGKGISVSCSDSLSGMRNGGATINDMGTTTTGTSSASDSLGTPRSGNTTTYSCTDKAGNTSTVTKNFYVVYKSCTKYNSCRHSSFGCESWKQTYDKCSTSKMNCSMKATGTNLCVSAPRSKTECLAISGCLWKQHTCAGEHWQYSCPSGWSLSSKTCTKTVAAGGSCSPGSFANYTYAWTTGLSNSGLSTCSFGSSKPTCSSVTLGMTYTTNCSCTQYNYSSGSVCGCARYNCTD